MRARLAFLTRHEALSAHVAPAGSCLGAYSCPPHDPPRRTRPAPRRPRTPRGPFNRPSKSISRPRHREPMIKPASDARRYRIVTRGECGRLLAGLVDNPQVTPQNGDMCVVALVRGPGVWGPMEQIQDLALPVVSLQALDHGNGQATALGAGE